MVSECARLFHKIIVFEYFLVADKKKRRSLHRGTVKICNLIRLINKK